MRTINDIIVYRGIYVYFNATGVLQPDVFINLQCNELCSCRRRRRRRCFLLFFYDGFIQRRPIRRRCNASFTVPAIILLSYERLEIYILYMSSITIRSFNSRKMYITLQYPYYYYYYYYYTLLTATSSRPRDVIFIVLKIQYRYSKRTDFDKTLSFHFKSHAASC